MCSMFKEKHLNQKYSYESYCGIFNCKFNISVGYPRKDTCSVCDKIRLNTELFTNLAPAPAKEITLAGVNSWG